jgi:ribosomal protein L11 methylase PrmA
VVHPASFRDPAGFIYTRDGVLYRQVQPAGRDDYERLMTSGLYETLVAAGDLIPHEEVDLALAASPGACRVLQPERIPFVSYPFEWSFGQLKDAALLTLRLQRAAIARGLSLRDATAYNVMFSGGRPVWIDTLSFGSRRPGEPWVAYRQFCEFFAAPLALMSRTDPRAHQLLRVFLDGVPLEMASAMLPLRTRLSPGLAVHVHMHAAAIRRLSGAGEQNASGGRTAGESAARDRDSRQRSQGGGRGAHAIEALVDSLERTVRAFDWTPSGTTWADYYRHTNYSDAAFERKRTLVEEALARLRPAVVWDLGANDGTFSRIAADAGSTTIAFDVDPAAVEHNYRQVKARNDRRLLPLLLDLSNPSPAIGWANAERMSLVDRGPADTALALALVHHLAIGHNVPLPRIASFLASLARTLVIEFVPKDDTQVQRMLSSRGDVFQDYHQDGFERAFRERFTIEAAMPIDGSRRTLYVMRRDGDTR